MQETQIVAGVMEQVSPCARYRARGSHVRLMPPTIEAVRKGALDDLERAA